MIQFKQTLRHRPYNNIQWANTWSKVYPLYGVGKPEASSNLACWPPAKQPLPPHLTPGQSWPGEKHLFISIHPFSLSVIFEEEKPWLFYARLQFGIQSVSKSHKFISIHPFSLSNIFVEEKPWLFYASLAYRVSWGQALVGESWARIESRSDLFVHPSFIHPFSPSLPTTRSTVFAVISALVSSIMQTKSMNSWTQNTMSVSFF